MRTPAYQRFAVAGAGLFPLYALVQSDGYFDSSIDSTSARAGRITRELRVVLPPAMLPHLQKLLQGTGWEVKP